MTDTSYVPGTGTAIVTGESVLLVPDGLAPDRVSRLWPLLSSGADLDTLLEALTEQGIRNTAPFVLLHGGRVLVRGDGCATLVTTGRSLGADGARTWAEHTVPDGEAVRLATSADAPLEPLLPLVAGVVHASAVLRGDVARAAAAADDAVEQEAEAARAQLGQDAAPDVAPEVAPPPVDAPPPAVTRAASVPVLPATPDAPPVPPAARPVLISSPPVWDATSTGTWTPSEPVPAIELVDGVPGVEADEAVDEPPVPGPGDHEPGVVDSSTVMRGRAATVPETVPTELDADHDGNTVLRSSARAVAAPAAQDSGPQVFGIRCPDGHANPPHAQACRRCGAQMADLEPELLSRPALGQLSFSDGNEVTLDRTVLIGRAPSANRFPKDDMPHLVRVSSPEQDISRTHVELRVEDWDVLLVDHSANGTRLVRPGMEPQMLHKGEPVPVRPGSVIDLGDGVTVTLEEAP